jgi:2-oxoglutarate ferredoxin oxidoreductase subunit gamma
MNYPLQISLCGFGGQGIVLSSVILGTAVVTRGNLYAVQTQSYGSEARGGQCQAELIVDRQPVASPVSDARDILVCMFQDAYDRYISTVKKDGMLVIDPGLVTNPDRNIARTFEIPATEIAVGLGNRMAANMVMLGFLSASTGILKLDDLKDVMADHVSERFRELNRRAIDAGADYAGKKGLCRKQAG